MKVDGDLDKFTFSDGQSFFANGCVIGISPGLDVSEGWDDGLPHEKFTPAQRAELADYMIGLWTQFKAAKS